MTTNKDVNDIVYVTKNVTEEELVFTVNDNYVLSKKNGGIPAYKLVITTNDNDDDDNDDDDNNKNYKDWFGPVLVTNDKFLIVLNETINVNREIGLLIVLNDEDDKVTLDKNEILFVRKNYNLYNNNNTQKMYIKNNDNNSYDVNEEEEEKENEDDDDNDYNNKTQF